MATPRLPKETCDEIRRLKSTGIPHREIAEKLGVALGTVNLHTQPCFHSKETTHPTPEKFGEEFIQRAHGKKGRPVKQKPPPTGEFTRFFVWPDTHIPDHNPVAVDLALQAMSWFKPHITVILGDFLDCAPVSHWLRNKRLTTEGMRLADDYAVANAMLDDIEERTLDEIVYIEGNHEDWIRQLIDESPGLAGLIDLSVGMRFNERRERKKITTYRYGGMHSIGGNVWFTHGSYVTMHHAKKHVESYRRTIVYGHTHDVQEYFSVSPVDIEDKHKGLSMGCLSNKKPEYQKNRPNNWVHAFGLGTVRPDGTFNVNAYEISRGQVSVGLTTFQCDGRGWEA